MKRVTLNVDLVEVRDLLEHVPRACIAFVSAERPHVEPARLRVNEGRYLVGIPPSAASLLTVQDEVVLLVDDGCQFFDLRAVYVRGHVQPAGGPDAAASDLSWFEVQPTQTVGWDYARIRNVDVEA